ncbi:glycosyltransferase family 2 protein [Marinobacter halodurans]|uniref:glycosyltransferase family 2 protein n=1 Tax=Marinobacter halodurans TaxID=2528979 RepID=UPI0013F16A75|nr:glycosyltransferase [Marinobacter halodurans]
MKLSIIIPIYNSAHTIVETIDSVMPVVGARCEVLIIDDGSTDNISAVLAPYIQESNIRLIRQKNSGGPASPRNRGVRESSGEYVMFLDADDVIIAGEIPPALALLDKHQDVSMICSNFDVTDGALNTRIGANIDRYTTLQAVLSEPVEEDAWKIPGDTAVNVLLQANFVGTSSVIARRACLVEVGSFDETLRNLDDRDMWIRLAFVGPILYRSRVFYKYRDSVGSISKQRELEQFYERVLVAKKVIRKTNSSKTKKVARQWLAKNLLKIGYILFHEREKSLPAFWAFGASFWTKPNLAAFKGVLKSLLPRCVYRLLART